MARTAHSPYSRGAICYPSVVVAAASLALWLLWPPLDRFTPRPGILPKARVHGLAVDAEATMMHRNPLLFARSLVSVVRMSENGGGRAEGTDTAMDQPVLQPKFLPMREARPAGGAASVFPTPEAPAVGAVGRLYGDPRTFRAETGDEWRAVAEMSPALAACGFTVPPALIKKMQEFGKPCMLMFSVELGADGRPASVFLEEPSGHKDLDSALTRLLWQAEATVPGKSGSGRVIVSSGRP